MPLLCCQELITSNYSLQQRGSELILLAPKRTRPAAVCFSRKTSKTQVSVRRTFAFVCTMTEIISAIGFFADWDVKSLLLFIAVFILVADCIWHRRPANFPPGPRTYPIVGNLLKIDFNRTHESLNQVEQQISKYNVKFNCNCICYMKHHIHISFVKSTHSWRRHMEMCSVSGWVSDGRWCWTVTRFWKKCW